MSFIGQALPDKNILFNGTVTTIGTGSSINTSGFAALSFQISNNSSVNLWSGIVIVEGSNDNINWSPLLLDKVNELSVLTQIDTIGIYSVKADTLYIRYNIQNINNSCNIIVTGNTTLSSQPVDKLAQAMDAFNNTPLYTAPLPGTTRQDSIGALIPSDAVTASGTPATVFINSAVPLVIDTQGYQSICITTGLSPNMSVTGSNDGVSYNSIIGYSLLSQTSTSSMFNSTTNYIYPCHTRYIKISATGSSFSGSITYYLRQQPFSVSGFTLQNSNIQSLNSNGIPAVGTAPITTAMPISGTDYNPNSLVRRLITDPLGGLVTANRVLPSSNAAIQIGSATVSQTPIGLASFVNQIPMNVQDSTQFESQSQIEILGLILQELKILNQQIYELPRIQAAAFQGPTVAQQSSIVTLGDEPTQMRNDSSLFINQQ
jgi:hypothetical protein